MKWRIGGLDIDGPVVLGPMSGYTSSSYRDFMKPFGVAASITEMVSDKGIIYNQDRTVDYLRYPENKPTGVQIFGSDPDDLSAAAAGALKINPSIDFFDVNMGCPVQKVTRNGGGSFLMKDPKRCGEIVRRMKSAVDVPVTAKIRLGWSNSDMNFREVISELENAEADCITLHVRTREDRYAGNPNYETVRNIREEMSVPLVISGNIYSLADAIRASDITGSEGIMVARGGVGNPYLVKQIDTYYRTGEILPDPTVSQQIDWCIEFSRMLIEEKGEDTAVRKLRSYAPHFIAGCRYGREYRKRLATESRSLEALYSILEEIRSCRGDETIVPSQGISEDFRIRSQSLPSMQHIHETTRFFGRITTPRPIWNPQHLRSRSSNPISSVIIVRAIADLLPSRKE